MALVGSRSAFVYEFSACASRCSECGARIPKDGPCLVSRRLTRKLPGIGKVVKKVCSQECRETFDDKLWQALANEREFKMLKVSD